MGLKLHFRNAISIRHIGIIFSIVILIVMATIYPAVPQSRAGEVEDEYKQFCADPAQWIFGKFSETVDDLQDSIQSGMDGIFDGMWDELGKYLGEYLGQGVIDSLSQFISIGPFINLDIFLNQGQPSEAQILTEIILKAIEELKEDILYGIEAQYMDEIRDNIDSLINGYGDHNARINYKYRFTDANLIDEVYMPKAIDILSALEGTAHEKFTNLHYYMLVNSLWVQMLMEDVKYDHFEAYGPKLSEATEEEIVALLQDPYAQKEMQADYESRLRERLLKIQRHFDSFSLTDWREASDAMFVVQGPLSGEKTYHAQTWSFDHCYHIGDKEFCNSFFVAPVRGVKNDYNMIKTRIVVTDAFGEKHESIHNFNAHNYLPEVNRIVIRIVPGLIQKHKDFYFPHYVQSGYGPIKEMLDCWWVLAGFNRPREMNAVDQFLAGQEQNLTENIVDILTESVGDAVGNLWNSFPDRGTVDRSGGDTTNPYEPTEQYVLTSTASYSSAGIGSSGGSISPSGAVTLPAGASQSYSITPAAGYHIDDVEVDGVSVGAVGSYQFENIRSDHTIEAFFAQRSAEGDIDSEASLEPLALYDFRAGTGDTVYDISGYGEPLNLTIADTSAAHWLTDGGLRIDSATIVSSGTPANKIIDAVKASKEITVEAWIKPANTTQDGPARIVTLSADPYYRDFTLGQGLWGDQPTDLYDVRLRTSDTGTNGKPSLSSPAGSLTTALTHVVFTRDKSGNERVYLNGTLAASGTITGDLTGWAAYPLSLGNELSGERPWLGTFYMVAIYDKAVDATQVERSNELGPGR